jgi:hypothetical protein
MNLNKIQKRELATCANSRRLLRRRSSSEEYQHSVHVAEERLHLVRLRQADGKQKAYPGECAREERQCGGEMREWVVLFIH